MAETTGLMRGKRGLIMGVANNRSIAWGIAKACHAQGAAVALTYQGDSLKKRVEPWPRRSAGCVAGHCDVTDPATIDAVFAQIAEKWGSLDFVVHAIAFSDKDQLTGRYVDCTAENFSSTLLICCYSFTAVAQRAEKLMPNGGSLLTLTYYGAEKWMPHYNVMGVAKAALEASVRYLAADLGQKTHPRQCAVGRTDPHACVRRYRRLPLYPEVERIQLSAAADGEHRGSGRCRALPPLRPVARGHRRGAPCRRRLSCGRHEASRRP